MKQTENHYIANFFVMAIVGLFVYLPCDAQSYLKNQNLDYWASQREMARNYYSQRPDFNYVFRSRVVNDSTLQAIRDCHIINKTQNMGTVSDAYGDFKISANINDSIFFSAIGFENLTIAITEAMYNYGYIVKLKPKTYELSEITVKPYQIDMPQIRRSEIYSPPLPNQGGINIPLSGALAHPVTYFYDLLSKEGKQKRYYRTLIEGTADFMLIGEKFNGELVAQLTGFKDDELIKFMSFCNFSTDFLLNYSPETIRREIRRKLQEYLECHP